MNNTHGLSGFSKSIPIIIAWILVIAITGCNEDQNEVQITDGMYQSELSAKHAPVPDTIRGIRYLRKQMLIFENKHIEAIDCVYKISQDFLKPTEDTARDFSVLKGEYRIVEDSILFLWDSLGHVFEKEPGKLNFDTVTVLFEAASSDHKSKIRTSKDKVELVDKTTAKAGFNPFFKTDKKEF